jgi:trimeric autotransporter adhesin
MNKSYRSLWNEALGAWVAVSEISSARGKRGGGAMASAFHLLAVPAAVFALLHGWPSPAPANVITSIYSTGCETTANGTIGRVNPGGTQDGRARGGPATDGSGTYSLVAGCMASGSDVAAVTAYGAFAQVTGKGGSAFGFLSKAGQWSTAFGLESSATGISSIAMGYGSNAAAKNAVAIGGSAADGTASLSVANSTTASGDGAVAIGSNARASRSGAVPARSMTTAWRWARRAGLPVPWTRCRASPPIGPLPRRTSPASRP